MHKALSVFAFAAVTALGSTQASAAPIFFDDFTQEAYGLNQALDNWTIADGSIDVVGEPANFPGLCALGPSPDKCVDLDGSTGNAGRIESNGILLGPGTYDFSFWLKGNSRGGAPDTVRMTVETGVLAGESFILNSNDPWTQYTRSFTLGGAQTVNLVFDHAGNDNIGILLDNISITQAPEPGLISLLGIGMAGAFMRRRRA